MSECVCVCVCACMSVSEIDVVQEDLGDCVYASDRGQGYDEEEKKRIQR